MTDRIGCVLTLAAAAIVGLLGVMRYADITDDQAQREAASLQSALDGVQTTQERVQRAQGQDE